MVDDPQEPQPAPDDEPVEDTQVEMGWFEKAKDDPEEMPVEDTTVPMEWLEEGEEK